MRLVMKCAYCGERVIIELDKEDSKVVLSGMKGKDLFICEKCCNDTNARIWLSKKILEG